MLKNRTYVALAALVVVAGLVVWKVTRKDPHAVATPAGAAKWDLKKEVVDALEISEPGKPAISLKKEGGEWKLVTPVADRADQKAVDGALDALASLKLKDVIAESPDSYDQVGVKDADVVKVVPKKGDAPIATLLLGKTSNVRLEGDAKVYSTANLKRWALVKEARLWRDRTVLDAPADKTDHIEVVYPAAKMVVRKEAPASQPAPAAGAPPPPAPPVKWIVTEGHDQIGGALDENVTSGLVGAVTHLEAEDIVEGAKPDDKNGLGSPRATVVVALTDGTSKTLLIGKDDGQTTYGMLKGGDRIWKLHKYEADRIPASPAQWRDKTIVRLEGKEVAKIELVKDKDRLVLERVDDTNFKATAPANVGDIDQTKVSAMLRSLAALRAARVVEGVDAKAAGLDKPTAVATFWKKDGSSVKLTIGAAKNNEYTVQASTQKDLYALSEYQAKSFMKTASDFKKTAAGPRPPGGM